MRRATALFALCAAAALLGGCAVDPATELPDGVSVSVRQNRDDYAPRRLEIVVTNGSALPLDVWEARLDSPAFAAPASTPDPATIRPGGTTALRLQLTAPDCSGAADLAARVALAFTLGGSSGVVSVVPDDPFGTLPRIRAEDCLAERVAVAARIEPGDRIAVVEEGGRPVAHLRVALVPTGVGGVRVDSVARTVLLRPASGADGWPVGARIDSSSGPVLIDLPIVPSSCRVHTVAEDKLGTVLPVAVTFDDGTSGVLRVPVEESVRGALLDFIAADSCAWAPARH